MNTLEDVLQLWQSNPEFREQFKKHPQDALKNNNIELSTADFNKIQSYVTRLQEDESGTSSGDQELEKRISK